MCMCIIPTLVHRDMFLRVNRLCGNILLCYFWICQHRVMDLISGLSCETTERYYLFCIYEGLSATY